MNPTYMLFFGIFAVVAYLIFTDESVAAFFYYTVKLVKVYFRRQIWWLTNNPRNPVVKYLIYRRSLKLSERLIEKINKSNEA
jgi:hypothetical protein